MIKNRIKRGDIYYCNLDPVKGSVQGGVRPVIVIQNQVGNDNSSTLIIAVVTTVIKKAKQPTHILIGEQFGLPKNSMVMFEQIKTIDKCELLHYIGRIDDATIIKQLNDAMKISLGLDARDSL